MTRKLPITVLALAISASALAGLAAALPASGVAKPKSGDLCTKSQLGKTSSNLVCSRSGTRYRWFVRQTSKVTTTTTPSATPPSAPSTIEVVSIVFGTLGSTNSLSLALTCTGLGSDPTTQRKEFKFGVANATDSAQFALQAPSTSNPTGSGCSAALSVQGTPPSALQVLLNGRSIAGPSAAGTLAVPSFTADGPLVLTVLQSASGISPTTPGASTTVPGGTTPVTTVPPPGPPPSGKPEIRAKFTGPIPPGVLGIDIKVTCTPAVGTTAFQVYSARIARDGLFIVPAILAPASASNAVTSCQIEGLLAATPTPPQLSAQVFVNAARISGPSIGSSINSPAFEAGQPFTSTIEFIFPGDPAAPTTVTTTPTATTTPATSTTTTKVATPSGNSLTLDAATGTVPPNVLGYLAQITCTNVLVGGVNQPTFSFSSNFSTKGGVTTYPFTGQGSSQCQLAVSTLVTGTTATTGSIQVQNNGALVGAGTASANSSPFGASGTVQLRVLVGY